jgi:hypothetical protein
MKGFIGGGHFVGAGHWGSSSGGAVSNFPSDPNPKKSKKWIFVTVIILVVLTAIIIAIIKSS